MRYEHYLEQPFENLDNLQQEWLQPPSALQRAAMAAFFGLNWVVTRLCFRLRVRGLKHLPRHLGRHEPVILAPNHTSSLDPVVLAAALPLRFLRNTYWIGRKGAVLKSPFRRLASRLAQTVPVARNLNALAAGAAVLEQGHNLVWFPEGTRTPDGELQPFKPGIGMLMEHFRIPVLPAYIDGAFEAFPLDADWPKLGSELRLTFGPLLHVEEVPLTGDQREDVELLTAAVEKRVAALAPAPRDEVNPLTTESLRGAAQNSD